MIWPAAGATEQLELLLTTNISDDDDDDVVGGGDGRGVDDEKCTCVANGHDYFYCLFALILALVSPLSGPFAVCCLPCSCFYSATFLFGFGLGFDPGSGSSSGRICA